MNTKPILTLILTALLLNISCLSTTRLANPHDDGLLLIPGGTFTMSCSSEQKDCIDREKTTHQVTLSDFYIDKYEVTQRLWQDIMGTNPSTFTGCDDCPVEQVSWEDTQTFLQKLNIKYPGRNYRLPTEAEWEYAARGGKQSKDYQYAGSNDIDDIAWYGYEKSDKKTHPVGQKKANELGLYDMSGNVWEWCSDWKGDYTSSNQTNPTGPTSGSYRVIRGGSWSYYPQICRVALRFGSAPGYRDVDSGFRLARTK